MSVGIFAPIILLLLFIAFIAPISFGAITFCCLTLFVAAQAVSIGGLSINPAVLFCPLFGLISLFKKKNATQYRAPRISPGGWLLLIFVCYALIATVILPLIFEGVIEVIWEDRGFRSGYPRPLHPGIGNITQLGYLIIAVVAFFATYRAVADDGGEKIILRGVIMIAILNILFSILDVATAIVGGRDILNAILRSGNYLMRDGDTITGVKRVVGTFTEASFFGVYTLGVVGALYALFARGYRRLLTGTLVLLNFILLLLSLSTTAYAGLLVYFLLLGARGFARLVTRKRVSGWSATLFVIGFTAVICIGTAYVVLEGIPVIDALLLKKLDSSSGRSRSNMNLIAWQAFLDSYGLGVGVGSTRASSLALVLLSNVGLIGFLLYYQFLRRSLVPPAKMPIPEREMIAIAACREGVIAALIGATISTPILDIGLLPYILAGASSAICARRRPDESGVPVGPPQHHLASSRRFPLAQPSARVLGASGKGIARPPC